MESNLLILMKEEVYDIIRICRKLSANPYIATPPNIFLLFVTNPRICSKKKKVSGCKLKSQWIKTSS